MTSKMIGVYTRVRTQMVRAAQEAQVIIQQLQAAANAPPTNDCHKY